MRNYFPLCFIIISSVLALLASGCGEEELRPPIIFSITADPDIVMPGQTSRVTVEAGDPDKDVLTYTWEASAGVIQGGGKTITWSAPETEGKYELTVTVSDGSDSVSKSLPVRVWTPRPGDYYPLAIGNKWTFQDDKGNTIEFEIVDTITIESLGVTSFIKQVTHSELEGAANFIYIAKNSNGVLQYGMGGANVSGDTLTFSPELPVYKYPLIPGEKWVVESDVILVPGGYFIGNSRAVYEVLSEENFTVPAGTFNHVFQVKENFTWELLGQEVDEIITTNWLAPNVGVVKFTQEESVGEETIYTEAILQSYSLK